MPSTPSVFHREDTRAPKRVVPASVEPTVQHALSLLNEFRFLSERQLNHVVDGVGTERLAELANVRVLVRLDVPAGLGIQGPVYALGREGALLVRQDATFDGRAVTYLRPSDKPKSLLFLAHTLARNEFGLCLRKATNADTDNVPKLIAWEHAPDRIADFVWIEERGIGKRVALVADAHFAIQTAREPKHFLVEIDRGTIAVPRMALRYRAYAEWWRQGGARRRFDARNLRVLTVAPTQARVERLRKAARTASAHGPLGIFLFAMDDIMNLAQPRRIMDAVWRPAGEGVSRSLLG